MCKKTSAELLSIPRTAPPLCGPAPEKFTSMFFVFACYLLFHNGFYEGARRFPPWSPKTMWPVTHLVPLGLKIPLMTMECGSDLSLSLFWPAQAFFSGKAGPFPSLISTAAVSGLCHKLCPHCGFRHLHWPTWFWLENEEFLSWIYPVASWSQEARKQICTIYFILTQLFFL